MEVNGAQSDAHASEIYHKKSTNINATVCFVEDSESGLERNEFVI